MAPTSGAGAIRIKRPIILRMAGIADIDHAAPRIGAPGTSRTRGHDAIEHIYPAAHRADQIRRRANTHQIARLIGGQQRRGAFQRGEHGFLAFTHGKATHRIAFKANARQGRDTFGAEIRENTALDNAKQAMAGPRHEGFTAARRPAHGKPHGCGGLFMRRGKGRAFIKAHGDISAEQMLDFHAAFRCQAMA